ncbi:MAG: HD domain-containing protein [Bacteroidales bacterium]|nr:HD domain-containing protein [Bacteroidales bacterium]
MNKRKILNDPVHGFITLPSELFFDLIEHPYFQRLRRIKQLGLTHLVYPGALHTRFHHALGAMHLMQQAILVLRSKGHAISDEEAEGVLLAILLHDIGHGPFSHALEHSIVEGTSHEELSDLFIERLNTFCGGKLSMAHEIFRNRYHKSFLHKLVASQLDMDRLDYLTRDSFFTGVSEGVISSDRIIQMLNIHDDELVVDAKGIYSIEKFIVARRLMYWQVYLHKTVLGAEQLMIRILRRARELAAEEVPLFATPALTHFLTNRCGIREFYADPRLLDVFAALDDFDIFTSVKVWQDHPDPLLSMLSRRLANRKLLTTEITAIPPSEKRMDALRKQTARLFGISNKQAAFLVFSGEISTNAYDPDRDQILLLYRDGEVRSITRAAEHINIGLLSKALTKYYLCYPKELGVPTEED